MPVVTLKFIDLKWTWGPLKADVNVVFVRPPVAEFWPSSGLLDGGRLNEESPAFPEYIATVTETVREHLSDNTVLVLPEFGCSPAIATALRQEVEESDRKCIVVGGSYYRPRNDGRVEIVCPIFVKGAKEIYYQTKWRASQKEEDDKLADFFEARQREVLVFRRTGFGNLATQVCSDVLEERFGPALENTLRDEIDVLIVVSRNKSQALTGNLRDLSRRNRWFVAFCNGGPLPSEVFSPFERGVPSHADRISATDRGEEWKLDVRGLDDAIARRTGLRNISDPVSRPRHPPHRDFRAMRFGRALRVLAVGSHFDDIWLGCSGTLMLLREHYDADITCVSLCSHYPHRYFNEHQLDDRAVRDTEKALCEAVGFKCFTLDDLKVLQDRDFEAHIHDVTHAFRTLRDSHPSINLIFLPRSDDLNRDHVLTASLGMQHFKCDVLEYEVKDFRRQPFRPNVFVDLGEISEEALRLRGDDNTAGETFVSKKLKLLDKGFMTLFAGQRHPMSESNRARMMFRASQHARQCEYAEAFVSDVLI